MSEQSSDSNGRTTHSSTRSGSPGDAEASEHGFIRALTPLNALFIGFGAMIGFGWVTLTGGWLVDAGTYGALLAFLAGGVIMSLVGVVYSEMVSAMPHAGGEHNYLLRGFGPKISMIGSWAMAGGYIAVVCFEAVSISTTAGYLFPNLEHISLWTVAGFDVHLTWALVGSISAIVITWINIRGVRLAGLVQTWVVSFLVIMALVMLFGGVVGGDLANTRPFFTGGATGFIAVLGAIPFLFVGFDVIPQSAEEVKVPPRQVGKLVVASVIMTVVFYLIIVFSTSLALPASELSALDLVTADALAVMLGDQMWGNVVIAGGMAGILTSWIAFLMGGSRLLWALARTGMIPSWFGTLHPKYRTPVNALLFIGALSAIAPFFGEQMLNWVVDASSPMIIFTYGLVAGAFLILRRREPDMDRPLRVGGARNGGVAIGVGAAVLCAILFLLYIPELTPISVTLDWQAYLMFSAWMVVGLILMLRIPGGIKPGRSAEQELLARLKK